MNKRETEKLMRQREKLEKELVRLKEMSVYEEAYAAYNNICGIDEEAMGMSA